MAFKTLKNKIRTGMAIAAGIVGLAGAYNRADAQSVFFDIVQRDGLTALAPNTTYAFDVVAKTDGLAGSNVSSMNFSVNVESSLPQFSVINTQLPISNDFFGNNNMLNNVVGAYNSPTQQFTVNREIDNLSNSPSPTNYSNVASFYFTTGPLSGSGSDYLNLGFDSLFAIKNIEGETFFPNGIQFDSYSGSISGAAVPEPSTYAALAGLAAAAAVGASRATKRKKNAKNAKAVAN